MSTKFQVYSDRIDYLRDCAQADGYDLNLASSDDFWSFIKSVSHFRKGNLVLLENGNLSAKWKDDQGNQLGLQFLGSKRLEYVIFKRDPISQQTSSTYGGDTFDGVKRRIDGLGLDLCFTNDSSLRKDKYD